MLSELIDNSRTDKNRDHSYIDLYQKLLVGKKETALNVLEIGIGDNYPQYNFFNGGSIKLWHDFFTNATVHALDIKPPEEVWDTIKNNDRIILYLDTDSYDENFFKEAFLAKNIKFDFMLDDGPHTLESMKQFIKLYSQVMTDDGILIIEDVHSLEWLEELKKATPEHLKEYIETYDLRHIKGRYDDIVFVINKSIKK
jgi:hypothetical protein